MIIKQTLSAGTAIILSLGLALPVFAVSPNASPVAQARVNQYMRLGARGNDVLTVQAILAADESVYPEALVTGYYGPLTASAMKRFQKKYGIEQVGFIGPKTLKKLNEEAVEQGLSVDNENDDEDVNDNDKPKFGSSRSGAAAQAKSVRTTTPAKRKLCANVPPGHLIAKGWLKKNGGVAPVVPSCQTLPPGIAKKIVVDPVPPTPPGPDTTAPVISSVSASVGTSSASITWNTNESATSRVVYGTTTSYGTLGALNSSLVTSHAVALNGLATSTMYNYAVVSKDSSGNTATSSNKTFTTSESDVTSPVISSIFTAIGSQTAFITWLTDEPSNSKVYYGTTTPMSLSSTHTKTVSNSNLVTTHALGLLNLSISTTYYYVLESKDAANNVATSTERSLTTNAF